MIIHCHLNRDRRWEIERARSGCMSVRSLCYVSIAHWNHWNVNLTPHFLFQICVWVWTNQYDCKACPFKHGCLNATNLCMVFNMVVDDHAINSLQSMNSARVFYKTAVDIVVKAKHGPLVLRNIRKNSIVCRHTKESRKKFRCALSFLF